MNTGLEERFEYLKKEKEKDLVQESKAMPVETPVPRVTLPEKQQQLRRIRKELVFFLGATGIAVLAGWLLWGLFVDQIAGSSFEPGAWESSDEDLGAHAKVKIETGIWRAGLGQVVYSVVCLLGVYLTRVVIWAVTHVLPEWLDGELAQPSKAAA